jgi:hypothetical protein
VSGIDPRLDAIVLRALEKDPAKRYQYAEELKTDLLSAASDAITPAPQTLPADAGRVAPVALVVPLDDTDPVSVVTSVGARSETMPQQRPVAARWVLTAATLLAAGLCFLGAAGVFLPWSVSFTWTGEKEANGFGSWHGAVAAGMFLGLGLALLACGGLGRPLLWRPLVLFCGGTCAGTLAVLYMISVAEQRPPPTPDPTRPVKQFMQGVDRFMPGAGGMGTLVDEFVPGELLPELKKPQPRTGPYLTLGVAAALLALGALQLRLRAGSRR